MCWQGSQRNRTRTGLPSSSYLAEVFRARLLSTAALAADTKAPAHDEPLDYVRIVDQEHERRRDRRKHGFR